MADVPQRSTVISEMEPFSRVACSKDMKMVPSSARYSYRFVIAGVILALLATACSSRSSFSAGVAAHRPSATSRGLVRDSCQPSRGHHSQGLAFGESANDSSTARLGPGAEVSKDEAADKEAPHKARTLIIHGTVYRSDCFSPLAHASINVWQTDASGEYGPGHGTSHMRCCYLMAMLHTDEKGHYRIRTVMPGHYRGAHPPPPAHIHFDVLHPGTGGFSTELNFAGDPYLGDRDPRTELTSLRKDAKGTLHGVFDIVVWPEP